MILWPREEGQGRKEDQEGLVTDTLAAGTVRQPLTEDKIAYDWAGNIMTLSCLPAQFVSQTQSKKLRVWTLKGQSL